MLSTRPATAAPLPWTSTRDPRSALEQVDRRRARAERQPQRPQALLERRRRVERDARDAPVAEVGRRQRLEDVVELAAREVDGHGLVAAHAPHVLEVARRRSCRARRAAPAACAAPAGTAAPAGAAVGTGCSSGGVPVGVPRGRGRLGATAGRRRQEQQAEHERGGQRGRGAGAHAALNPGWLIGSGPPPIWHGLCWITGTAERSPDM